MIKILIADDERSERELLTEAIAERFAHEAQTRVVENGREAVETAALWNADIVLMDIEMPGINGIEAAKRILVQLPDCKVIFYADNQPEGYPTTMAAEYFAQLVEERTEGRVCIRVFSDGVLGDEVGVFEQVQFGGVDMSRISVGTLSQFVPEVEILQLPYLFKDSEHMWRVLDGEIGDELLDAIEKQGAVGLSWFDAGARNFYTTRPVRTMEDLSGMRIRVQESSFMSRMVRLWGATPIKNFFKQLLTSFWALAAVIIVVVGVVGGAFTATESAAIAVIYSLLVSVFIYKGLNWKGVWKALDECVNTLSIVLILIATSAVFGNCLTMLHVPDLAAKAIVGITDNRFVLIILINVILLVLGCIMDMAPIILIATPILLPIATQYCGLDPVQFGIMVVLNCGIGLLTPPVGAVLFIGSAVGKCPMEKVVKATLPFYLCMIVTLLLISFIPDISLLLPKAWGGYVPTFGG